MKLAIPQLILATIAGAFFLNSTLKFVQRKQNQTFIKFLANALIWGSIFVFSLYPPLSHSLSRALGFGENLNTFIFIGFVIVFMVLFKVINMIERIERNISEIVRKEALEKIKK